MTVAKITAAKRKPYDRYCTNQFATKGLLDIVPELQGSALECCSGNGDIASPLWHSGRLVVYTNDLDPSISADFHFDATVSESWRQFPKVDFVVTNPPFATPAPPGKQRGKPIAHKILELAYEHADVGVAFFLRKSHSEPCLDRREWLRSHKKELAYIINVERLSFTDDGRTESVSCDWFVWLKGWDKGTTVEYLWPEQ